MRKFLLIGSLAMLMMGAATPLTSAHDQDRGGGKGQPLRVVGLTADGRLVAFNSGRTRSVDSIGKVAGLSDDTSLVGIDYRVQDGKLYAVGNKGGIYTLSTGTAKATKVAQLSVALAGNSFGVDFNPAANRLRVISDTGQNLRHNIDDPMGLPAAGTTAVDGTLTYPPATAPATGVTAAAYTNNDLDPSTATTLFDLDTTLDQVSVQSPANAGSLAPTGKIGVDARSSAGFDIYSPLGGGKATSATALATLQVAEKFRLYQVDLLAGSAKAMGTFPSRHQIVDLAIQLDQRGFSPALAPAG
jgi:hypothetical protein